MREMLGDFINQILSAQADTVSGADYRATSVNHRNGYRHRLLDTRVGTVDVAISKLRHGYFFSDWLLERRTRTEPALTTVIATCYLKGVSTLRTNDLFATLGITDLGLTPAHAGNTGDTWRQELQKGAHPRSRGEHAVVWLLMGALCGSSPLTRGAPRS